MFRGVFPTHERAAQRVKTLMTVDPYFDLHIVKTGTWTTIGAGKGEDVEYENAGVHSVMQGFFDQHYTDLDAMKSRIRKAKAEGMPGIQAEGASAFFDANSELGIDAGSEAGAGGVLPAGALHMSAAEAVAAV